jgi:hypothetical protein
MLQHHLMMAQDRRLGRAGTFAEAAQGAPGRLEKYGLTTQPPWTPRRPRSPGRPAAPRPAIAAQSGEYAPV